jgi:hypothetical protein
MQKVRQNILFLKRDYSESEIVHHTGVTRPTIHLYSPMLKGKSLSNQAGTFT